MPPDDPRLICPVCGKLVEVEAERFEDLFDEDEPLESGEEVAPTLHASRVPKTPEQAIEFRRQHLPDSISTVLLFKSSDVGPLTDD